MVIEQKFSFSPVGILFTIGILALIFIAFFKVTGSDFFLKAFPNTFIVPSGSIFLV